MMMTKKLSFGLMGLMVTGTAFGGEGLYSVGAQPEDLVPLQWIVGVNTIYDDNATPGSANEESSYAVSPYVGAKLTNITPQTIVDLYAQIGMMYYFDKPSNIDSTSSNSRLNLDIYHDVSERLSINSKNFIAYELEPNYSYGYASSRQNEEHLYWNSDQSVDFNWTPRFTTRTGVAYFGTDYKDSSNLNRQAWSVYNQFRYRLNPQSVLTSTYRYTDSQGDGVSSNSTDQYLLVGLEHRFSPNTIGRFQAGAQLRDVDGGQNSTSPYAQMTLISQVNTQLLVRSYVRYSIEDFDTVQFNGLTLAEYDQRKTLRVGLSSSYQLSPKTQLYGGVDYIPTSFEDGRSIPGSLSVADQDETVVNAYIGFSLKFTETIQGSCSYNYTNSNSDLAGRDYDRNRISVGVSATF